MLKTLTIANFRGFERFEMGDLGRVNLLVGTNNCGKTSVLEAIQILATHADLAVLRGIFGRRGEGSLGRQGDDTVQRADVRHLFRGHVLGLGKSFVIAAEAVDAHEEVRVSCTQRVTEEPQPVTHLALDVLWLKGAVDGKFSVWLEGQGILVSRAPEVSSLEAPWLKPIPVRFITTESASPDQVVRDYESIALAPEEEILLEALRTIEPDIDRIGAVALTGGIAGLNKGGLVVRRKSSQERVPIGSMGDGIWRLLGIALSLVQCKGGILLVDEIDTGLHFTVMADMWKLVMNTAKRFDVQVFATTHSRDCYEALASISRSDVPDGGEVSIQRIERGRSQAVAFTEREIVIAAERGIEVR